MLFVICLLTLSMGVGLNYPILLTLYVVRRVDLGPIILKRYENLCFSFILFEISLLMSYVPDNFKMFLVIGLLL